MSQQPDQSDYEPEFQPPRYPYLGKRKNQRKKLLLLIGGGVLLLLLAAAALWYFMGRSKPAPVATTRTTTQTQSQTPAMDPSVASTTQTFKSAKLNIQVTYRKDWTLTESADKTQLTLASPSTTYTKGDGTSATGSFTVKIREDVPDAMQATIQKMIAAEDSTVIAYTQPTPNQRQYTNLSFAGAKADVFNFFMITGDNAYKAGAAFGTGIDFTGTTYLIVGGYGADTGNSLAFDSVPKAAADGTIYEQGLDIAKTLQIY